jgi:hypothetical protein
VSQPVPPTEGVPAAPATAEQAWLEAARLRAEHRKWIVIWLAPQRCFRAYARLPGAKRDTALSAATSAEMATLITQAEQSARAPSSCQERS